MFRKVIKKLNNLKFTALIAAIISGVSGVYGLASFFLYHFAGDRYYRRGNLFYRFTGFFEKPFVGMALFFMALFTIVFAIFVICTSLPFIKNKEKLLPKKTFLMAGFIGAFFELALIILMFVLLAQEPQHEKIEVYNTWRALLITSLPFGILSVVGEFLFIFPFLSCDFYLPEIKRD